MSKSKKKKSPNKIITIICFALSVHVFALSVAVMLACISNLGGFILSLLLLFITVVLSYISFMGFTKKEIKIKLKNLK